MSDLILLPEGLGALVAAGLIVVSFLTSFTTAAFGIGGGLMLLAVMASLVPAAALIPVHGIVQLGSNAGRAVMLRQRIVWPILVSFAIGRRLCSALLNSDCPIVDTGCRTLIACNTCCCISLSE